jgi:hypothetical protein
MLNSGSSDGIDTRRGSPVMVAGFKGDIQRRPQRPISGGGDCHHLGVIITGPGVKTLPHNFPIATNKDSTYAWIGMGPVSAGDFDRPAHHRRVSH